jgi:IclR family transcriptional regulator, KDG regulon repressor
METTLLKGLAVLEALVERDGRSGVSELASALKLSRSNTHRLLNTLVAAGFATVEDGRYSASLKAWELGIRIIHRYDVRILARPAMELLAKETSEDVRLTILDPNRIEVVFIDKIESPHVVRTFTAIGSRLPAQSTASGRILLAYQEPKFIKLSTRKLKPFTRWTITDPNEFVRQLAKVRRNGFAVNIREYSEQVVSIAAPLIAPDGTAMASISIAAPADRMTSAKTRKATQLVCAAAQRVSLAMRSSANVVALYRQGPLSGDRNGPSRSAALSVGKTSSHA